MKKIILIGDIGGTNSNFALVEIFNRNKNNLKKKKFDILYKKTLPTNSKNSFEKLINKFLENSNDKYIEKGIFAVAGKIDDGKVKMTNTNLVLDIKKIIKGTQLKSIKLINDFTAISYSIDMLNKNDLLQINKVKSIKTKKPKVIIGAGTGLGKSILIYDKHIKQYTVIPSEGGHDSFPIKNEKEFELLTFLQKNYKRKNIEIEDILSGKGLEYIYTYLHKSHKTFSKYAKKLSAKEISLNQNSNLCAKETFKLFYKFYARASRDFAIEVLSEGGVYLAGGIISKNYNFNKKEFLSEFEDNYQFKKLLKTIPIYVIKNYSSSIYGLINYYLIGEHNE